MHEKLSILPKVPLNMHKLDQGLLFWRQLLLNNVADLGDPSRRVFLDEL
jgi:hypothetical protein